MSLSTRIFYDSSNHMHRDIQYHPEQSARIDACLDALSAYMKTSSQHLDLIDVSPVGQVSQQHNWFLEPFPDADLEYARQILIDIHSAELVESLETKCRESRQRRTDEGKSALGFIGYLDDDTYITTESFNVCLRAAACWIECANLVLNSERNFSFALTRPPGHHATKNLPNGFCTFNFAAAASVHAMKNPGCEKITILDWDVHYGQGVADIVADLSNIRYVSMHQVPAFPYTGQSRGVHGKHKNILTVPIAPDSSWACGYHELFTEKVLPFCSSPDWEPDLIIVCSGYDALSSDELASCSLVAEDYGKMTRLLRDYLGDSAKIMFGLEGGKRVQLQHMRLLHRFHIILNTRLTTCIILSMQTNERNLNLLLPCDIPRISTKTKCTWRKSSRCRRRDGQSSEMRNYITPKQLKIYT